MPVSVPVRGCKPLTANPVNRSTKSRIEVKHYYFSSWIFFRKEAGALLPAQVLAGLCPSRAPFNYDYIYLTFCPAGQDRDRLGQRVRLT
jgi:hypothetical protein